MNTMVKIICSSSFFPKIKTLVEEPVKGEVLVGIFPWKRCLNPTQKFNYTNYFALPCFFLFFSLRYVYIFRIRIKYEFFITKVTKFISCGAVCNVSYWNARTSGCTWLVWHRSSSETVDLHLHYAQRCWHAVITGVGNHPRALLCVWG